MKSPSNSIEVTPVQAVPAVTGAGIAPEAAAPNAAPFAEPSDAKQWPVVTDFQRHVYCILGLPFDVLTQAQAVQWVQASAQSDRRCFFSTPNLNFLVSSRSDAAFRDSVLRSDLSMADGMPMIWVARALKLGLKERVAGSSVYEALRQSTRARLSVYFFGGPEGAAQAAHEKLQASPGGLTAAGFQSPGFGTVEQMSTPEVLAAINASQPDFVLVALGAKKGQAWIERNMSQLTAPVISHLGAVVNFAAGSVKRAPAFWQKFGLEWLWRIREEPALWKRYAQDGTVFLRMLFTMVLPSAIDARLRQASATDVSGAQVALATTPTGPEVTMRGAWTESNLKPLRDCLTQATQAPGCIVVNLQQTTFVDSACLGLLLLLRGHQSKLGLPLRLEGCSPKLARQLRLYGVSFLLNPD